MRTIAARLVLSLLVLAMVGCGARRGSEPATTAAAETEASSGGSSSEAAGGSPDASSGEVASGDARTVTAVELAPLGEGYVGQRVRVHGFALQMQGYGGNLVQMQIGDAQTSDSQPYVSCRPAQDAPIPESAVEWMGEVDVEGTVEVMRDGVLLTGCTLRG